MRELRFSITRTIPAAGGAIWRVVGDFGTEHRWTASLRLTGRVLRELEQFVVSGASASRVG
jgi:hypothetical protein